MSDPFDALLKPEGHKDPHTATVGLVERSGRYRLGPAVRPAIHHDNGFLDKYQPREPTAADRMHLAKWIAKLEGAEALCNAQVGKHIDMCNNEDLSDATAAYRHFLFGKGADRTINYERYLQSDPAAANLVPNIINDFREHTEVIGKDRIKFSVTSEPYTVGRGGIAPYPKTANWQKALGAHFLWVSADVDVTADDTGKIWYDAALTIHMEDRYNFNPGSADIATGTPDSENGVFEITGLAKQYMNFGAVVRHTRWAEGERIPTQTSDAARQNKSIASNGERSGKRW